jgi:protein kinase
VQVDQLACIAHVLGPPSEDTWPEGYRLAERLGVSFPPPPRPPHPYHSTVIVPPVKYSKASAEGSIAAFVPSASRAAVQLIASMCAWNPAHRPSAAEALNHPFFQVCTQAQAAPCLYCTMPHPVDVHF